MINQKFEENLLNDYNVIRNYIISLIKKPVSISYVRKLVHDLDFTAVKSILTESKRMEIKSNDIWNYYVKLDESIRGVPVDFILNMDESGVNKFHDRTRSKCIVPNTYNRKSIRISVERESKKVSLIACITASGQRLPPGFITHVKYLPEDLSNFLDFHDCHFYFSDKCTMNNVIFHKWLNDVVVPSSI